MTPHSASITALPAPLFGTILADLSALYLRGDDVATWLQGQVTNDLRPLEAEGHAGIYTFITTVKGRVIADAWVHRGAQDYCLTLNRAALPALQAHFDRFIIMEDVELHPSEAAMQLCVLAGPGLQSLLHTLNLPSDAAMHSRRLYTESVDLWLNPAEFPAQLAPLQAAITAAGGQWLDAEAWEQLRIARGVPCLGLDFDQRRLPQETSLTGAAVSFSKGCYQGQEAVVMLQQRGRLSRKLFALQLQGQGSATAGDPIVDAAGDNAGELTSVTALGPGQLAALGYLRKNHFPSPEAPQSGSDLRVGGLQITGIVDPETLC